MPHSTQPPPTRDWAAVVARLAAETPLTLAEAARLFPRVGVRGQLKRVHESSVLRWILSGKRGIFLDGKRSNGKGWWTSREAVQRFEAALSALADGETAPKYESVSEWERRAQEAAAELERLGA